MHWRMEATMKGKTTEITRIHVIILLVREETNSEGELYVELVRRCRRGRVGSREVNSNSIFSFGVGKMKEKLSV